MTVLDFIWHNLWKFYHFVYSMEVSKYFMQIFQNYDFSTNMLMLTEYFSFWLRAELTQSYKQLCYGFSAFSQKYRNLHQFCDAKAGRRPTILMWSQYELKLEGLAGRASQGGSQGGSQKGQPGEQECFAFA